MANEVDNTAADHFHSVQSVHFVPSDTGPLDCFLRLKALVSALSPSSSIEEVVSAITTQALSTIGADMGIVAVLSEDGKTLDAMLKRGDDPSRQTGSFFSLPMGLPFPLPAAVRERRPFLFQCKSDCLAAFPRFTESQSLLEGAAAVIPMMLEDRVVGAIGLSYHCSRGFSEWELPFLETAATLCAQAIDRAQLQDQRLRNAEMLAQRRADHTLRGIVDCITDSVAAFDSDLNLLAYNSTFAQFFLADCGKQAHVGMSMKDALADRPEYLERLAGNWRRALEGDTFTMVREVANHGLEPQFLETSYSSYRDEVNGTTGAVHVSRNITERIRAENALKRGLSQLADAQTVAKIGSWSVDVELDQHVWSDEMYRLLEFDPAAGVPPAENIIARYHPEGVVPLGGLSRSSWTDLQPYNYDSLLYLPDGKEKWVHRIGRAQKDIHGRVVTVLGTVMDITDRKLAERALMLAQEQLEEAQQVAHIGSWQMDVPTRHMVWSREFIRSSHREVELDAEKHGEAEALAEPNPSPGAPTYNELLSLYVAEDAIRLDTVVNRAISEGVGYELDVRRVLSDGTTRSFREIGRPVKDSSGVVTRLSNTCLDTTEHQELESQLRQVQKMETIGRFAGAIAHDFNNLLAIIMGHAELMSDALLDQYDSEQSLKSIENAANRAANLTQQLLAFAHKQVNNPVVLQPNDLLVGATAMLRPLIGQSIELITRFAPDIGNIFIDSNQLEQVIVNLVVNARDAMPDGGQLILQKDDVTLRNDLHKDGIPAGRYVVISITDTGIGMTKAVQERLFEPFFTTKEKGKGTGLGLATVYGIVQQNKGYISVISQIGVGTKFMVYFPSLDDTPEQSAAPIIGAASLEGTETILVVDDESMLRGLMVGALRKRGYSVLEAADGVEALQVANQHDGPIHMLVTDVNMPNMNGIELAARMKALFPDAAALLVSGYSEELFAENVDLSDALPLLRKPFKTRDFLDTIRSLLADRMVT